MIDNLSIVDCEIRRNFLNDFWQTNDNLATEKMEIILNSKFGSLYDVIFCREEYERDFINWFMLILK